jgi:hypothetical protein
MDEEKKMHLEYHSRDQRVLDWHNTAALAMMGGGAVCSIVVGLWAIHVPKADPLLIFPLFAGFGVMCGGVVWWMLNRRGLS